MVSQSKKRIRRFSFAVKIVILDDELEFSKILDKKISEDMMILKNKFKSTNQTKLGKTN